MDVEGREQPANAGTRGLVIFSIPLLLLSLSICCCPEIVLKSKGKGNAPEDPSPYAQKSVCMNTLGSDTSPRFSV